MSDINNYHAFESTTGESRGSGSGFGCGWIVIVIVAFMLVSFIADEQVLMQQMNDLWTSDFVY